MMSDVSATAWGRRIIPASSRLAACALALVAGAAWGEEPARIDGAAVDGRTVEGAGVDGAGVDRVGVAALLSGPAAGFERALRPRPFVFPADHGAHPGFRTEWWYFTGNLRTAADEPVGFQLTFFRFALAPPGAVARASAWGATQVWMAHFAISDPRSGRVRAFERFARGALGLAGATAEPLRIWLGDWSASGTSAETFPVHLQAQAHGYAIDLSLTPERAPVAQGDGGLSAKSDAPGNASHYYSYTRLRASGSLATPHGADEVRGLAWLDREWSTSALASDQAGWDWFALQLDDGRDLMFYRLRRADGSVHPASAGVVVGREGGVTRLGASDLEVEALGHWDSPQGGARYPVRWRLRAPDHGIDLRLEPLLDDQEVALTFRYWEGAVRASGRGPAGPIEGVGYVELTGYGDRASRHPG
jgi:predicted secreted hydrolase